MNDIARCPHCATRMVLSSSGLCPACGKSPLAPILPPPPPPPPPPRHPFLLVICLVLIISGFWRFYAREHQVFEATVIDLMLIWMGALGVVGLAAMRYAHIRRHRRSPPA
jgi:hypothetical protein